MTQTTPTPLKRVYVETLGCSKNRVDSEILLGALEQGGYGYTTDPAQAQVIVVNTCAFLTSAAQESVDRILELADYKQEGACEKLVCAGCLTERYREKLLDELEELDGLFGSSNFQEFPALLDELYGLEAAGGQASGKVTARQTAPGERVRVVAQLKAKPHYEAYEQLARVQTTPRPYAYLKVAEGCSNMCTFCNIPFIRGGFSSRPLAAVVEELARLVEGGIKEVNLVAQDLSSYGVDLKDGTGLEGLLRAINLMAASSRLAGLGPFWVRLFYAYPNSFTPGAMAAMAESPVIVPYLDMPFQHISSPVLKAMNRRIDEAQIRAKLEELKTALPRLALRTTFITGFPTETGADFERLRDFVAEGWFDHVGVFPYSHEDNIVSAKYGDPVPAKVKEARRAELMAVQQQVSLKRNQGRVGQRLTVLVEGVAEETDLLLQGRAPFMGPEVDGLVYINEGQARAGAFHTVEITGAHPYDLIGHIVEEN